MTTELSFHEPARAQKRPQKYAQIVAIGSSTGDPTALVQVLKSLSGRIVVPVLITQHIASNFTSGLAQNLSSALGRMVFGAKDGMPILPGHGYLASGDRHLTLVRESGQLLCRLDNGPAENYCKPSVNPMLRSVADVFGRYSLAVIMTGMGKDGLDGCHAISKNGGMIIAQDRASSAVWEMPRAVFEAGICTSVISLNGLGDAIMRTTRGF